MPYRIATTQDRFRSATGAAILVGLIGYGLIVGLAPHLTRTLTEDLKVVALLPDAPPRRPDPVPVPKQAERRKEAAAAPPNLKSKATEIVAPPVPVVIPRPQPVVVAPVAGPGADRSAGSAPVAGPGTGSGGQGDGRGSGNGGDGDGGGGGTEAELVSNKLRYKDLPRDLWNAHAAGLVIYRATIGVDGRLHDCRITRTSGNAALDAATCALALRYVRFRPARDETGRKVPDTAIFEQEWTVDRGEGGEPDDG